MVYMVFYKVWYVLLFIFVINIYSNMNNNTYHTL